MILQSIHQVFEAIDILDFINEDVASMLWYDFCFNIFVEGRSVAQLLVLHVFEIDFDYSLCFDSAFKQGFGEYLKEQKRFSASPDSCNYFDNVLVFLLCPKV